MRQVLAVGATVAASTAVAAAAAGYPQRQDTPRIRPAARANVSLTLAPSRAVAVVDGRRRVRPPAFSLAPGTHRIVVTMPDFFPFAAPIYIVRGGTNVVRAILIPRGSSGMRWLQRHPAEASRRRALARNYPEDFMLAVRHAYPIFAQLPFVDRLFAVAYGKSLRAPRDPTAIPAVFVTYYSEAGRRQAIAWLKFKRYDPARHEVVFRRG